MRLREVGVDGQILVSAMVLGDDDQPVVVVEERARRRVPLSSRVLYTSGYCRP